MKRFVPVAALLAMSVAALPAEIVTVTVSPITQELRLGGAKTYYASVSGSTNKAVNWLVNNVAGGNAQLGTISTAGLYTSPAVMPASNLITIKAVSQADTTKSGTGAVTLLNPIPSLTLLDPAKVNIGLPIMVSVTGKNFVPGAVIKLEDAAVPTTFVSSTLLQFKLTAAGVARLAGLTVTNPNPGSSTSSARTLTIADPIVVSVSPATRTIRAGNSQVLNAYPTNALVKTVKWFVNGVEGGNASVGAIDGEGLYQAPLVLPVPNVVAIKAVSVADPSKWGTAEVTLQNALPVLSTVTPGSVKIGAFTLTLDGTGFAPSAQATFANKAAKVTWLSTTRIQIQGDTPAVTGGIAAVRVSNPEPGPGTSNLVMVSVKPAQELMSPTAASRLLEQASWGPSPSSLAELQQVGMQAWLNQQFNEPASTYPDPIDEMEGLGRMQKVFFKNAFTGKDQLRQRVAFALGQIVVVSGTEVNNYHEMVAYQRMLSQDAFGNYLDLMRDVALSPAMGIYLDNVNNAKPDLARNIVPNENFGRELLQLFTIGLVELNQDGSRKTDGNGNPIPTYSEDTVKKFALAFTGWTFPPKPGFTSHWKNPPYFFGPMVPFDAYHDLTAKPLLNSVTMPPGHTAREDLEAGLLNIFQHPNVGPFVSLRLIQKLTTSNPSPGYISRVAGVFNNNGGGVRGDLRAVVRAILEDTEAGNAATGPAPALASTQGHLREPVVYSMALLRALGATVNEEPSLASQNELMGEKLFYPPSVFNYFSPLARVPGTPLYGPEFQILNPSTALARVNFVYRAVRNGISSSIAVDTSNLEQLAENPAALADAVSTALMRGQMPPEIRASILKAMATTADKRTRARDALYLAATAGLYQVQR